jgi:uncharacterized protein YciI
VKFIMIGHDQADGPALRQAHRAAHLAYWRDLPGKPLYFGGPMLSDAGAPRGSMMVIEAADEAALQDLLAADPYVKAALFAHTEIAPFRVVFEKGELLA